jgi:copper homeostasis protein
MPLEIACFNPESALLALEYGADRIELCAGALVGGTTPSLSNVKQISSKAKERNIPVYVMIRPRGGNFDYSEEMLESMKKSIREFKDFADGFVFGVLNSQNRVDMEKNLRLLEVAGEKPCTFHRAFDEVPDILAAADEIAHCGFAAILTSGGDTNAVAGADVIAKIVERTRRKLDVITGGSVRSGNIVGLKEKTRGEWFHSSAITDKSETASPTEVLKLREQLDVQK